MESSKKIISFYERNGWFDQAALIAKTHGYYARARELCRRAVYMYARAGPRWIRNALDLVKKIMTRDDRKKFKERLRLDRIID